MPYHTEDSKPPPKKRGRPRKMKEAEPAPAPAPEPSQKPSGKLSDKQRQDLRKHMEKSGLSGSEAKSHRMKMMSRMRRGMSIAAAHKDIGK
jgi:hypothetical protein